MNHYITRDALKDAAQITRTGVDERIDQLIETVSRQIDAYCGTQFYVSTDTRRFTARTPHRVRIDDLLALTSLKTDEDGARTFGRTWAASDYELRPYNAPRRSPPHPYREIVTTPDGRYSFPCDEESVEPTGRWGFYQVLERSTATVGTGGITNSATSLPLTGGTALEVGMTLLLGSEQLFVSAIASGGTPATVVRGVNGTTAAAHAQGAVIDVFTYPLVSRASLIQCERIWRRDYSARGDAEAAVAGGMARLDKDVMANLDLLRARSIG